MNRLITVISIIFMAVIAVTFFSKLEVLCNDDVYVYFNYARNFVAGYPFAYDARGIPSEGYTGLLYLLVLIPFQYMNINMMYAGILLNIIALFMIILAVTFLFKVEKKLEKEYLLIFACLLFAFIALDSNTIHVLGLALETMVGVLTVIISVLMLSLTCTASTTKKQELYGLLFFISVFIAYLVRPENILFLGVASVLILYHHKKRASFIKQTLFFFLLLFGYHLLKLYIFDDIFPTGFYRKVSSDINGLFYVLLFLYSYGVHIILLLLGSLLLRKIDNYKAIKPLDSPAFLALLIIFFSTIVFFVFVSPLFAPAFRYLFNSIIIIYIFLAYTICLLIKKLKSHYAQINLTWFTAFLYFVIFLNAFNYSYSEIASHSFLPPGLYAKAETSVSEHKYIKFGTFLKENVDANRHITFVFGDAGAIPYSAECIFIDTNGLTEPFIAHLFRYPDGEEKNKLYLDYILSWDPDIIVIATGEAEDGFITSRPGSEPINNPHSPFSDSGGIERLRVIRNSGFYYIASIYSYYDLHFGVNPESRYFDQVAPALIEYSNNSGYILEKGLTVKTGSGEVYFPNVLQR